ncbi:MAG: metallophosphoesterase [Fibrobacteria bacterium]|nr:metallophosphoesterase [Fibrobacteria bacterium]
MISPVFFRLAYVTAFLLVSLSCAQQFIRYPYLQQGTPESAIICWRYSEPEAFSIKYGTSPDNLNMMSGPSEASKDACLTLDDSTIIPYTKYYYKFVQKDTLVDFELEQFFVTHPSPGQTGEYTFWVVGDGGDASRAIYENSKQFKLANGGSYAADGILFLGDNAYDDGTDAQFTSKFFGVFAEALSVNFSWSTIGNHENLTKDAAPYHAAFVHPTKGESGGIPSNTEYYYSFDYGNIHFISLDSEQSARSIGGPMYTWLEKDLKATKQDWIITYFHHPPYSFGSHNSDKESNLYQMRENFVPLLEDYGVDAVYTGHSHAYERSFYIDRAYGNSKSNFENKDSVVLDPGSGDPDGTGAYRKSSMINPHEGTVYIVTGSASKLSASGSLHPMMYVKHIKYGTVILTVNDTVLTSRFIDRTGAQLDQFQIVKNRLEVNVERSKFKTDDLLINGRGFSFPKNNSKLFRLYKTDGTLVYKGVPKGVWIANKSDVPNDVYIYRYGETHRKVSLF